MDRSDSSDTDASDLSLVSRHLHSVQLQVHQTARSLQRVSDQVQVLLTRVEQLEHVVSDLDLATHTLRTHFERVAVRTGRLEEVERVSESQFRSLLQDFDRLAQRVGRAEARLDLNQLD